jgi:hypothetical protein
MSHASTTDRPATELSLLRLYAMRATYLLIVIGIGPAMWTALIHHGTTWTVMQSAAFCLLGAVTLLAALGIRYPVRMLPLLLFELTWKAIWLIAVARPLWSAGLLDADMMETVKACGLGVILFPLVIPWKHVWAHYVCAPGDRWR